MYHCQGWISFDQDPWRTDINLTVTCTDEIRTFIEIRDGEGRVEETAPYDVSCARGSGEQSNRGSERSLHIFSLIREDPKSKKDTRYFFAG